MLLADLADTSAAVAATPARSAKVALIAAALARAVPEEVPAAVAYLSGELLQRRTGVGWAALRELPPPAATPGLGVAEVDAALAAMAAVAGTGSQAARRAALHDVMGRATADEQQFLSRLLTGDLRQGALESLVVDAVAQAAGLPRPDVRRAVMLRGEVGPVALAALTEGAEGLGRFRLEVGRPVQPMLASTADSIADALARLGAGGVEAKLDGIRVQVHRWAGEVRVFTRSLEDITLRVPEIVEAALSLPVGAVVLDGEAIAVTADGRPRPFQVTGSRTASTADVTTARRSTPLTCFFFDILHLDGKDVLGWPGRERADLLERVVPAAFRVPRVVTADVDAAAGFLDDMLARGHEGAVVKSLDVPYEAGRRGVGWLKVKPVHTLDLVVLAAEWGSGRRRGWLSNLHLGARSEHDVDGTDLVMLGKTFKGLTDAMLTWQTEQLLGLERHRNDWQVFVRPELVVEVAFDGVQTSTRYPGGMALRFARVLRHRPDKPAAQADTVAAVRGLHQL